MMDGGMEDLTGLRLTYSRFVSETQYYNKRPRVEYVRKQMDLFSENILNYMGG